MSVPYSYRLIKLTLIQTVAIHYILHDIPIPAFLLEV